MARILVIEDDPTQRLLISSVFRGAGYDVVEAEDGEAGLKTADDVLPDLIVCDVLMPGLNGYEFVEALKRDSQLCFIPVIMLTALAERSHVRVGMTAGADDYLFKPVRAAELRHAATALLAKRESHKNLFAVAAEYQTNRALKEQQNTLLVQYELRLVQEINKRWTEQAAVGQDVFYDDATVVVVDAFAGLAHTALPALEMSQAIRRVFQAASDSLYLFGARHLVLMGDDLLAVFPANENPEVSHPHSRALRAAFGVQKMMKTALQAPPMAADQGLAKLPLPTISLHAGAVQLIHIEDPLHGGHRFVTATGVAVEAVKALNQNARTCDWKISASSGLMRSVPALAFTGRKVALSVSPGAAPLEAVEVLQRMS